MAEKNFQRALKVTLKHEGGWADHPSDPGGATMMGITIGRFREYKPNATKNDLRNIPYETVERIYHVDYWNKVKADLLPAGLDLAAFDYAVNSGPARSAKYLQGVLGVAQDGIVGPETLKAAVMSDVPATIKKLCARRLSFVRGLSTFKVFGKGWSRRIAEIEATAVAWSLAGGGALSEADIEKLRDEAASADAKSSAQAGGTGVGGGTATGGLLVADVNWIGITIAVLALAAAVVLIVKARQNKERATAYRVAAVRG